MTAPLFNQFAHLWVPLGLMRDFAANRAYPLVVAGERVVLFRDEEGALRALLDRCPHRGVALSLGEVERGQITCPFHGWRFDGTGACTHVPWNPDIRRTNLSAHALPLCEVGGLVWLYTGREASDTPSVPPVLKAAGMRVSAQHFVWDVHWTRVMENMLDTPHLPFVHKGTIGRALKGRAAQKMDMAWEETETGARILATRAGEATRTSLLYHFPNIMELAIDPGPRTLRLLAVCTPEASGRTRLSIYTVRSFARWRRLDPLFARINARIAHEDRAIVESSLPREVPPAAAERSVPTDAPTLAFRKIWFTRIRPSAEPLQADALP